MSINEKVPVTILTGFLGSGKTTLLNRILSEEHGKRIAVIENEYGEVGIDQGLVINADEEVFEMSNGCICCTCLLYTSPSPRDGLLSRMPSSA